MGRYAPQLSGLYSAGLFIVFNKIGFFAHYRCRVYEINTLLFQSIGFLVICTDTI